MRRRRSARFDVSRESADKIAKSMSICCANGRATMNLVSKASLADVWTRHIADSLQLLRLLPQSRASHCRSRQRRRLSRPGAGLARPALRCIFMKASARRRVPARGDPRRPAPEAEVHQMRIEEAARIAIGRKSIIVTARAVAPLDRLLEMAFAIAARRVRPDCS